VLGGVDPGLDDCFWGCEGEGSPGDVLAYFVADVAVVDVAGCAQALQGGVPAGADVVEVVAEGHVLAVVLGCCFDAGVVA
jgi:hypothetical protein